MLTTWYCFSFSVWVNTFPWACDELKTLLITYHSTIIGPVPAGQGFLWDDNPHVQCSTTPISFIKSCYLWTAIGYFVRLHLNKRLFFHLLKPVVCSLFNLLQKWAVSWWLLWASGRAMHLGKVQPCPTLSCRNHQLLIQHQPTSWRCLHRTCCWEDLSHRGVFS